MAAAVGEKQETRTSGDGWKLTVEPVLFSYTFASALLFPTISALIYRKVCLAEFNGNMSICDNLANESYTQEENLVQSKSAKWFLAIHLSLEIPSLLLSFFYGALSDKISRKLAILLPAIGSVISTANTVLQSIYMELPVWYLLFGAVVGGLCGGWVVCNMASFSYLSDITSEKSRTFRIVVAESILCMGIGIAFLISGVTLDHTSFPVVTTIALLMYALAAVYTLIWIRDPPDSCRPDKWTVSAICGLMCTLESVWDMVGCIFKERERNARTHILLGYVILVFGIVGGLAGIILSYLYLRHQPLSWSQSLYGLFVFYGLMVTAVGQVVIIPWLRNHLGMRETTILIWSIVSTGLALVLFAVSVYTWMVFLVPIVGIIGISILVILKSVLSKLVGKNELGRMFAAYGALQSISAAVASVLYNSVYAMTLDLWPGLSFLIGAAVLITPLLLAIILRHNMIRHGCDSDLKPSEHNIDREEMTGLMDDMNEQQTAEEQHNQDQRHFLLATI